MDIPPLVGGGSVVFSAWRWVSEAVFDPLRDCGGGMIDIIFGEDKVVFLLLSGQEQQAVLDILEALFTESPDSLAGLLTPDDKRLSRRFSENEAQVMLLAETLAECPHLLPTQLAGAGLPRGQQRLEHALGIRNKR